MKSKVNIAISGVLVIAAVGSTSVWAKKVKAKPVAPLTEAGQQFEAHYTQMMETLKADINQTLPDLAGHKMAAYQEAREVEKAAEADRNAKLAALKKSNGSAGLLNHRKGWIGRATTGVAEAKETLKLAEAMTTIV